MSMERALRGIAGAFILVSLVLAYFVSRKWLWFTAFVGFNLFQSAFTNWCPMMWVLKRCGIILLRNPNRTTGIASQEYSPSE